jgi:hypothetical protein
LIAFPRDGGTFDHMFGKSSKRTQERLEASGVRADATVLEVSSHGLAISHNGGSLVSDTEVSVKLRLRVEPPGESSFELEKKLRFAQLAMPSEGQRLAVIFDPADHDTLMLDENPVAVAGSMLSGAGRPPEQVDLVQQLMASALGGASSADTQAIAMRYAEDHAGATVIVPGAAMPGAGPPDPVELLTRLADLKEKGLLTDAEFAAQKARILGG